MADFILDVVWKSLIEEMLECIFSITLDLTSYVDELYYILVYTLLIYHG